MSARSNSCSERLLNNFRGSFDGISKTPVRGSDYTSPPSNLYQYKLLDNPTQEIRVLTLFPDDGNSEVRIALDVIPFIDDQEVSSYTGLSYHWGTEDDPQYVVIDDGNSSVLPVTQNLHTALVHLRAPTERTVLWIDAICIDQNNPGEKGLQVALMSQIYKRAASVIGWLGPKSKDSDTAIDALEYVDAHLKFDTGSGTLRAVQQPDDLRWGDKGSLMPITETDIDALAPLMGRPWWQRLWVYQEIFANTDRSQLRCGSRQIPWSAALNAVKCITYKAFIRCDSSFPLFAVLHALWETFCILSSKAAGLGALHALRSCQCSEPRDRVYGALGWMQDFTTGHRPDYTRLTHEVYLDVFRAYLKSFVSLEILRFTGTPKITPNLPSFVPDWAAKPMANLPEPLYANGGTRKQRVILTDHDLRLTGVVVCHIKAVLPFFDFRKADEESGVNDDKTETLQLFLANLRSCLSNDFTSDERLCALTRTLFWDKFDETRRGADFRTFQSCKEWVHEALGQLKPALYIHRAHTYRSLQAVCQGQSFYTSDEGPIGLAPIGAQSGDIIAVLLGCEVAMALHPTGSGAYEVVGPAYCDGFMHGEAFLGPLPEGYEMIYETARQPMAAFRSRGFRNLATDAVEWVDPRLPTLPPEWQQTQEFSWNADGTHNPPLFQHTQTSKKRRGFANDPRLDIAALESRGVEFEEFILV